MRANQAIRKAQKAVDEDRMLLGDYHPDTLVDTVQLAKAYRDARDYEEARRILEDLLALHTTEPGSGYGLLRAKSTLAPILIRLGDLEAARAVQEDILHTQELQFGPRSEASLGAAANLSATLFALGHYEASTRLAETVLEGRRATAGPVALETAEAMGALAKNLRTLGEFERARDLDVGAVEALDQLDASVRLRVDARRALAEDLVALGDWPRAREVTRWIIDDGYPYLHPSDDLRKYLKKNKRRVFQILDDEEQPSVLFEGEPTA